MGAEKYALDNKGGRAFELMSATVHNVGSVIVAAAGGVVTTVHEIARGEVHIFHSTNVVD